MNLTQLQDFCKENEIDISCLFEGGNEADQQIVNKFGSYDEISREHIIDDITDDKIRTFIESVIYFPSHNLYIKELSFRTLFISTLDKPAFGWGAISRKYFEVIPKKKTVTVYVEP